MSKITLAVGAILIALGLIGYFGTSMVSWTALIPAFFGLPLAILGALALKEDYRKHAMHAPVIVGLVGFLGGAFSFFRPLLSGSELKPHGSRHASAHGSDLRRIRRVMRQIVH